MGTYLHSHAHMRPLEALVAVTRTSDLSRHHMRPPEALVAVTRTSDLSRRSSYIRPLEALDGLTYIRRSMPHRPLEALDATPIHLDLWTCFTGTFGRSILFGPLHTPTDAKTQERQGVRSGVWKGMGARVARDVPCSGFV